MFLTLEEHLWLYEMLRGGEKDKYREQQVHFIKLHITMSHHTWFNIFPYMKNGETSFKIITRLIFYRWLQSQVRGYEQSVWAGNKQTFKDKVQEHLV